MLHWVGEVLEVPQYCRNFLECSVDGVVLLQLNEHLLDKELGVNTLLHRMKLHSHIQVYLLLAIHYVMLGLF